MISVVRAAVHRAAPVLARPSRRVGTGLALTFDDGPDPTWTPRLLDLLADLEVRASFFLVGRRAAARPDLVQRMVREQHTVGSHTWSHPDPWSLSRSALVADYRDGRRAVEDAAGRTARLFRPPQGHLGLWESVAVRRAGLACWLWTVDTEDWRPTTDADAVVRAAASSGPGDVVLLHDALERPLVPVAADRAATLAAIPRLVAAARSRGLRLMTLDEAVR